MSHEERMIEAAERYLSRQPIQEHDGVGQPLWNRSQILRAFCAGHFASIEDDANDKSQCPVCDQPLKLDDTCATDIELGICHAACLEGSPVVDLDTGEEIDGELDTYRLGDLATPTPQAHVVVTDDKQLRAECARVLGLGTFMTATFENGRSQVHLSFDGKDDSWTFIEAMSNIKKLIATAEGSDNG